MLIQSTSLMGSNQIVNRFSIGIDMGKYLWVVGVFDRETGKYRSKSFRGETRDFECYEYIGDLMRKNPGKTFHVCYEAGRSGFTPARVFKEMNSQVTVLPVNKLELIKSGKKVKTDKIDAKFLTGLDPMFMRLPSVWVPSPEQEALRHLQREIKRLKEDIQRNNNRIISILERWPVEKIGVHKTALEWKRIFNEWNNRRTGNKLPESEALRICLLIQELGVFEANMAKFQAYIDKKFEEDRSVSAIASTLAQFSGISDIISRSFAWEIGDFRRFKNGKKISSYFGLTPTPYSSGKSVKEQGISKEGNGELRRLAIQLAWLWRQHQPNSKLTIKYAERLAKKGRDRKRAIVALARQLVVALYRYVVHGEEVEGAVMNNKILGGAARVTP